MKYGLLVKNSFKIVISSLCLVIVTLVSLNIVAFLTGEINYSEGFYAVVAREASFALSVLGLGLVVYVLFSSSGLDSAKYTLSVKISVLTTYLYLTVLMIISGVKTALMEHIKDVLPPYLALYLLVVILLVVAFYLTRTREFTSEERVVYVAGVALEITGVVLGLVVLIRVFTEMLKPHPELVLLATSIPIVALVVYTWLSVENTIVRIRGSHGYRTLQSLVLRRIVTTILGIAVALTTLIVNGFSILVELSRVWTFQTIREALLLVQLVALMLMSIGLVVGVVGGVLVLSSERGLKGILLLRKQRELDKLLVTLGVKQQ